MNKQENLSKLFEEFMKMKFPHYTAGNKQLHELFGDFVELDAHVAGLVSSYLKNAPVNKNFVYVDEEMNKQLSNIKPKSRDEEKALAGFINRKKILDEMISLLKELIDNDPIDES